MIKHEIIFWGLFLVFNYLQFLPNYIFNFHNSNFLPYLDKLKGKKVGFFANYNLDFFRYFIDISLLIILLKLDIITLSLHIITLYYLILFIYNFYHNLFSSIYQSYPSLYNDWPSIKTGLAILWGESKVKLILSFVLGLAVLTFIYLGFFQYLKYISIISYTSIDLFLAGIFLTISIISVIKFYNNFSRQLSYMDKWLRFVVGFMRIFLNVKLSFALFEKEKKIKSIKRNKIRVCPPFQMIRKPNFYFLFLESYGSILLNHASMKSYFIRMFNKFEKNLKDNNLEIVSNLSQAPSTSAFSWLCYSTFLLGYRISQHAHYESFLRNPIFYNSDNLMRILKNQGYTIGFLNPIKPNPRIKVDYTYLTPFYAVDQWILYDDLKYTGDSYGFGDSPPDQFSINRGREIIEKSTTPYALMFLTKNSHSPFSSPEDIAIDWRSLNISNGKPYYGGGFLKRPKIPNYLSAINYQLKVISDFIIKTYLALCYKNIPHTVTEKLVKANQNR